MKAAFRFVMPLLLLVLALCLMGFRFLPQAADAPPEFTEGAFSGGAGILLSLVLAYVPGLNTRWAVLDPEYKRAIFGGLLVLIAAAAVVNVCASVLSTNGVACLQANARPAFSALVSAFIGSQSAFTFATQSKTKALQAKAAAKA